MRRSPRNRVGFGRNPPLTDGDRVRADGRVLAPRAGELSPDAPGRCHSRHRVGNGAGTSAKMKRALASLDNSLGVSAAAAPQNSSAVDLEGGLPRCGHFQDNGRSDVPSADAVSELGRYLRFHKPRCFQHRQLVDIFLFDEAAGRSSGCCGTAMRNRSCGSRLLRCCLSRHHPARAMQQPEMARPLPSCAKERR